MMMHEILMYPWEFWRRLNADFAWKHRLLLRHVHGLDCSAFFWQSNGLGAKKSTTLGPLHLQHSFMLNKFTSFLLFYFLWQYISLSKTTNMCENIGYVVVCWSPNEVPWWVTCLVMKPWTRVPPHASDGSVTAGIVCRVSCNEDLAHVKGKPSIRKLHLAYNFPSFV